MMYEHKSFMLENRTGNNIINELFEQAEEDAAVISNLTDLFK